MLLALPDSVNFVIQDFDLRIRSAKDDRLDIFTQLMWDGRELILWLVVFHMVRASSLDAVTF